MEKLFRFQDLEIWKKAIEIGELLLDIADELEQKRLFRFAEQMRGAALSISNNIAEGAGSLSDKEFANFLNIARRSTFAPRSLLQAFPLRNVSIKMRHRGQIIRLPHLQSKIGLLIHTA